MTRAAFRLVLYWVVAPILTRGSFTPQKSNLLDRIQILAGLSGR